jgi:hypothetical protein
MKVTLDIRRDVPITPDRVRETVVHYLSHHMGINGKKANRRVKIIGVDFDIPSNGISPDLAKNKTEGWHKIFLNAIDELSEIDNMDE